MSNLKKKRIFIDMDRCIGCGAHSTACSIHHHGDTNVIEASFADRVTIPVHCRHCEEPLCLQACPNDAISKTEDGIVHIAKLRCTGCKSCINACPFGVIHTRIKHGIVAKCDLALERLERGEIPSCVATCPTGALQFLDPETELSGKTRIGARELGKNIFRRRSV